MLALSGIVKRFGGLEALAGFDAALTEGSVTGLIGPNGSGKTTLINIACGLLAPDAGRVRLAGTDVTGWPAHRIARLGLARTLQQPAAFARMSVLDNLRGAGALSRAEAEHMLERFGLGNRRDRLAEALPIGDLRRLDLARAVARNPRLLLLDEPAGGLTPGETGAMADLLRRHVLPGRTVLLIEHKMELIAALCPRVLVLDFGHLIGDGDAAAVLRLPAVRDAYLGPEDGDA